MSIKLFIEQISTDGAMGMTSNIEMMFENAKRIKIVGLENKKDLVGLIFQAGRYVAAVVPDVTGNYGMMFFDFKKDKRKALYVASQFSDNVKGIFMKNFDEVTKNYDKNYDLIELIVDKGFSQDQSAN